MATLRHLLDDEVDPSDLDVISERPDDDESEGEDEDGADEGSTDADDE